MAEVDFERDGSIAVATVSGEIDMGNAASIRLRISELVTPDDDAVVLDFSPLSFIDSAGLHALAELAAVLRERRQRLLLCVPPGNHIQRTLEIVGIPQSVSIEPDREAAIAAARESAMQAHPYPPEEQA
ncbi:MAG TPA: STAS domain-containing protein [Actinomycetota bacterium]|nr:STAS domain-containing protein [Actinomycetota bacterium]